MQFRNDVRPSPIAGTWYTGDPVKLAAEIDSYLENAKISSDEYEGRVVGLVAPHAGHRYSGKTAGYAYKLVKDKPRQVAVILATYHQYTSADFITTAHNAYQTPLGDIPVEMDLLSQLAEKMRSHDLVLEQVAQDGEHSVEIQLPFLQRAWQEPFSLIPLMVRSRNAGILRKFAQALHEVLDGQDYLLIASTDLSHFFPLDYAEEMDSEMLKRIKDMDPDAVLSAEEEGSGSACGAGGVAAMLWAAKLAGADYATILNYSTSADSTGDFSSVVGYGAAAVFAED